MKKQPLLKVCIAVLCAAFSLLVVSCNQTNTQQTESSTQDSVKVQPPVTETKPSTRPAHWGYEGDVNPALWATLSPAYAACGAGKSQSPVDLSSSAKAGEPKWSTDFKTTSLKIAHHEHVDDILDNGHTIQVTVDEGSTFTLNDKTYNLKQFHFHTPSEHTVDGKHLPLEMHMVHQSADGSFGVIALFFEEGAVNENFQQLVEHLPSMPGESSHFTDVKLDLSVHVPKDVSAYHYSGSFTTPPCTEQVEWLVLRNKFTMSAEQISAFSSRMKKNNRPVQALNDRTVSIAKVN